MSPRYVECTVSYIFLCYYITSICAVLNLKSDFLSVKIIEKMKWLEIIKTVKGMTLGFRLAYGL